MTLLEVMVILIILGVIIQTMLHLFVASNKVSVRLQRQIVEAQSISNGSAFSYLEVTEAPSLSSKVLICFNKNKTYGCGPKHVCEFKDGQWVRADKVCEEGVLTVTQ
jgi:Tfp pilus assembly protein PilV